MHSLAVHGLILLHWTAYAVFFSLAGRMVLRQFLGAGPVDFFDSAWTGVFVVTGLLQIWHLFLPVTSLFFWLLVAFALIEAWSSRRDFRTNLAPGTTRVLALVVLTALWLAQQSLDPQFIYDSEAYHFATIRWNTTLPLVPGLANLSIYYGLNQSYFLLAALIDQASLFPVGCLLTNGFLILLVAGECVHAGRLVFQTGRAAVAVSTLFLCLALPVVLKLSLNNLGSPTPDVLVDLVIIRYFARLLRVFETPGAGDSAAVNAWMIFAAAAITLKASLAGFAAAGAVVLFCFLDPDERIQRWSHRSIRFYVILGGFFLVPYLWRGVLASGYPLFPLAAFSLPLDWRVPESEVTQFSQYIRGFARSHAHGAAALAAAGNFNWVSAWAAQTIRTLPGATMLVTLVLGLPLALGQKIPGRLRSQWRTAMVLGCALAFWLLTAPDVRFGGYLLYAAALWLWAIILAHVRDGPTQSVVSRMLPWGVVAMTVLVLGRSWTWKSDYPSVRDFPMHPHPLTSGLSINVLETSADADEWRIGYAAPPATARVASDLVLRASSLTGGFRRTGLFQSAPPRDRQPAH